MPFVFAVAENLLLILALPWFANDSARELVARIDNRGMFSIPFCRSLAIACGSLLAIAIGVLANFSQQLSLAHLWDITGFWHEGRFLIILKRFFEALSLFSQETIGNRQILLAQILLAAAAVLTIVNFGIAVLGWRSLGALRGLIAHAAISVSVCLILIVGALAAFWVLHWLNFWIFLVLLAVLELRRREEATTKLSF